MIPRYSCEEMVAIWESHNKYQIWLDIELYAAEALNKLGVIPDDDLQNIQNLAHFNVERIEEIDAHVKHDVIAFLTNLSENIGYSARFVHQGMTSSDVLDTCLSVQLTQACDLLIIELQNLLKSLKIRAYEYKNQISIGRSHGVHAEPTTMGLKFASFYAEFQRNLKRLTLARQEISICSISGAVGTFSQIDPFVETYVAEKMSLSCEPLATQVIPRDRHAVFFSTLGIIACSIERLSVEIRNLQRTEIHEVEEFFSEHQKGSSAMPHKKNPIFSENLTGLARIVRSYTIPAMENVALWHERDISHSSVERVIAPDATITLHFALRRLTSVINSLIFYPNNIEKNLHQTRGLIFSQHILLSLTKQGMAREEAYALVQKHAMLVWDNPGLDLLSSLKQDSSITKRIPPHVLSEMFDLGHYTKHIDLLFQRVFQ